MENNNNKGQTIFLSVVGVATLLVALVGATFAFFSTQMTGDAGTQEITTAQVSNVKFTPTGFGVAAENILPGKVLGARSFDVEATAISPNVTIKYDCEISSTNDGITDLEYRVSAADAALSAEEWKKVPTGAASIFSPGSLPTLTSDNLKDTYNVELRFPETGVDQNSQQGKTANVQISCKLADGTEIFYNDQNQQGTQVQPGA